MRQWYVLFVGFHFMQRIADEFFGHCFRAERDILDLGFETFVPVETRTKLVRNVKERIINPIFGPYIFVRIDKNKDEWGKMMTVQGVIDILPSKYSPSHIPDTIIDYFKYCVAMGVFDYSKPKAQCEFQPNEKVEFLDGPLAGLIGKVKSASPRKRVKILLNALGTIEADPSNLRKVG